ncbi:MAG: tetratricopeptide repeat protein [Planctomycetota bacterium]|nr:tetratricopeptide repeat protein [Planctomycetota bacterium]
MIEVLIVALGRVERAVFLDQLPRHRRVLPSADDPNRYATVTFRVPMIGQRIPHNREVATVIIPKNADAGEAIQRAITRWSPKSILVLGAATALPNTELNVGDVLVAERLFDADSEISCLVKAGQSLAGQGFFKAVRDLEVSRWKALLERGNNAKKHLGTVAFSSGSEANAEDLRSRFQSAMALARDGAKVLSSLANLPSAPSFVGILGLIDVNDEAASMQVAMRNAAAFALACLGKEPEKTGSSLGSLTTDAEKRMAQAEKLYMIATGLLQKGQLEEALKGYQHALAADPDYAEAYSNRGVVKSALGDLDGAIADYNMAVKLKTDLGAAFYNLACAHGSRAKQSDPERQESDLVEALKCLGKALKNGFTNLDHVAQDEDLSLLHDRAEFQTFLAPKAST